MFLRSGCVRLIGHSTTFQKEVAAMNTVKKGMRMKETALPAGLERRKEDYGLITGHARYVDDLKSSQERPAVLHMAVVRSPYAHARIKDINLEAARALSGV